MIVASTLGIDDGLMLGNSEGEEGRFDRYKLGSYDLISVGRFVESELGPSDLNTEGGEEGLLDCNKLGPI